MTAVVMIERDDAPPSGAELPNGGDEDAVAKEFWAMPSIEAH
jgi:hypothetical protein